jgi:hypothetical protein
MFIVSEKHLKCLVSERHFSFQTEFRSMLLRTERLAYHKEFCLVGL